MLVIKTKPHADFPRRSVDGNVLFWYNKIAVKKEKAL